MLLNSSKNLRIMLKFIISRTSSTSKDPRKIQRRRFIHDSFYRINKILPWNSRQHLAISLKCKYHLAPCLSSNCQFSFCTLRYPALLRVVLISNQIVLLRSYSGAVLSVGKFHSLTNQSRNSSYYFFSLFIYIIMLGRNLLRNTFYLGRHGKGSLDREQKEAAGSKLSLPDEQEGRRKAEPTPLAGRW